MSNNPYAAPQQYDGQPIKFHWLDALRLWDRYATLPMAAVIAGLHGWHFCRDYLGIAWFGQPINTPFESATFVGMAAFLVIVMLVTWSLRQFWSRYD